MAPVEKISAPSTLPELPAEILKARQMLTLNSEGACKLFLCFITWYFY